MALEAGRPGPHAGLASYLRGICGQFTPSLRLIFLSSKMGVIMLTFKAVVKIKCNY